MKTPQTKKPEVIRDELGRIAKGNSGNPGGLHGWVHKARAMLEECNPLAIEYLRSVIVGGPVKSTLLDEEGEATEGNSYPDIDQRTTAAKVVLEYSMPKPKLTVEHEHKAPTKTLADMGLDEEEIIELARRSLEAKK